MQEITVAEMDSRRDRDQVIDVREDDEVAEGMIAWRSAGLPTS